MPRIVFKTDSSIFAFGLRDLEEVIEKRLGADNVNEDAGIPVLLGAEWNRQAGEIRLSADNVYSDRLVYAVMELVDADKCEVTCKACGMKVKAHAESGSNLEGMNSGDIRAVLKSLGLKSDVRVPMTKTRLILCEKRHELLSAITMRS